MIHRSLIEPLIHSRAAFVSTCFKCFNYPEIHGFDPMSDIGGFESNGPRTFHVYQRSPQSNTYATGSKSYPKMR